MRDGATTLRLARIGCVAARALREGARGTVTAAFERSLYLTLDDQWICVGPRGLGDGPLNAIMDNCVAAEQAERAAAGTPIGLALHQETGTPDRRGGVAAACPRNSGKGFAVGEAVSVTDGALRIGSASVLLAGAEEWRPPRAPAFDGALLAAGLEGFARALPPVLAPEGLAGLLSASAVALPPVANAAAGAALHLAHLVQCAAASTPADAAPLVELLGLGPGLTPSGDDFLGGAMVALHAIGQDGLRDAVWAALEPRALLLTNAISRAHLAAAAEGSGAAALHSLLDDVLAGRVGQMPARIAALAAAGHTSGWDALAGSLTVLRAASAPSA
jgi:hypothetical protein